MAQRRHRRRGEAASIVCSQQRAHPLEGCALHPLHEDGGRAVNASPRMEARHAVAALKHPLTLELLPEGQLTGMIKRRLASRQQRLQGKRLPIGVGDAADLSKAAPPRGSLVSKQDGIPAGLRRGIRLRSKVAHGLHVKQAHHARVRGRRHCARHRLTAAL